MIRALGLALVVALVAVWVLAGSNRELSADLAAAEAQITGYQEAARWWRAETQRVAEAAALDESLAMGVGADAPLSDYLRDGAGRVWP